MSQVALGDLPRNLLIFYTKTIKDSIKVKRYQAVFDKKILENFVS